MHTAHKLITSLGVEWNSGSVHDFYQLWMEIYSHRNPELFSPDDAISTEHLAYLAAAVEGCPVPDMVIESKGARQAFNDYFDRLVVFQEVFDMLGILATDDPDQNLKLNLFLGTFGRAPGNLVSPNWPVPEHRAMFQVKIWRAVGYPGFCITRLLAAPGRYGIPVDSEDNFKSGLMDYILRLPGESINLEDISNGQIDFTLLVANQAVLLGADAAKVRSLVRNNSFLIGENGMHLYLDQIDQYLDSCTSAHSRYCALN